MKIINLATIRTEVAEQIDKLHTALNKYKNELKDKNGEVPSIISDEFDEIVASILIAINDIKNDQKFLAEFLGEDLSDLQNSISSLFSMIVVQEFFLAMQTGKMVEIVKHFSAGSSKTIPFSMIIPRYLYSSESNVTN